MGKKLKFLITISVVFGLFVLTSFKTFAETPPVFLSATYNVGTGALVITGSNLAAINGANNDINLTKVSITDGSSEKYNLTTKGEITNSDEADIFLNSADKAALAKMLDKSGVKAANGGTYTINFLNGWNGAASTTYVKNQLVVNGVVSFASSGTTYDYATGKLLITGTNMLATRGNANDIMPKYLTITDGTEKAYTLTTSGTELTDSSSAVITLNAVDQLALQGVFSAGTSGTYYITAAYGWNGPYGLASMNDNPITLINYGLPMVTVEANYTVVYGGQITGISASEIGTIYVVPNSINLSSASQADLDALVADGTALKATVTNINKAISIPTKTASVSKNTFKFAVDTDTFQVVEVDYGGVMSAPASNLITMNNIASPALKAAASPGTQQGSTKVSAAVTANTYNTLAYEISPATITVPFLGTDETDAITGGFITNSYTSNSDIIGVDAIYYKYLGIYELDPNNKVVRFKQIALTSSNIAAATGSISFTLTGQTANGNNTITPGGTSSAPTLSVVVATGTNTVEMTGTKTPTQTVTIDGTNATSVTKSASATAPVYTVDTSGITGGGIKTFTITLNQTGHASIAYTVTVAVRPSPKLNDYTTLGLVGTTTSSSNASVATAAINTGNIVIIPVSPGSSTITVTNIDGNTAKIPVTISNNGLCTIGTIIKYPVVDAYTTSTNTIELLMGSTLIGSTGDKNAFTLNGMLGNTSINNVIVSGSIVRLVLTGTALQHGQIITVDYSPTGTNDLTNGAKISTFTGQKVTNNN